MRKRKVGINVRVTEHEKRKLALNARKCKLSLSAYLRHLGLGYTINVLPQKRLHKIHTSVCSLEKDFDNLSNSQIKEIIQAIERELWDICCTSILDVDDTYLDTL